MLLIQPNLSADKHVYIVTGPESSGSIFISKVVSHVLGIDKQYRKKGLHRMYGKYGDDILVYHASLPRLLKAEFCNLRYYRSLFKQYKLHFIITTRDHSVSLKSKMNRFGRSKLECIEHEKKARRIIKEIIENEDHFIWSYETMILLKEAYFQELYKFLGVRSDFHPPDLFDGNEKYIRK